MGQGADLLWLAVATVALSVLACVVWLWGASRIIDRVLPERATQIRPWLFVGPAALMMAVYLVWPALMTLWQSLHDARGDGFVGAANYRGLMADPQMRRAMLNNLSWLLIVPALSTALGLAIAGLTDRLRWGALARALIFLPGAISAVGAGVIWKFVYDYRPAGDTQIGLLNALIQAVGGQPQIWLALAPWNSLLLMAVMFWIQTGFATMILTAALRSIPTEMTEAAMLDGASGWRIFMTIQIPQISGAIAVVWTTITVVVLKVFDIVFVMTNGQWGTQVLAGLIYDQMFRGAPDFGRGAAMAVLLMAMLLPVMIWQLRGSRKRRL